MPTFSTFDSPIKQSLSDQMEVGFFLQCHTFCLFYLLLNDQRATDISAEEKGNTYLT